MIHYPSIVKLSQIPERYRESSFYTFAKEDGSNLRFEWTKNQGWHKYGSRTLLIDKQTPLFGQAIDLFQDTLAKDIEKVAYHNNWQQLVIFAEYFGPNSFAGMHQLTDSMQLTPFDAHVYKHGFLAPERFVELFGHLPIAKFLGKFVWNQDFIQQVKAASLENIAFEGVVGKIKDKQNVVMVKAKTNRWISKVKESYSDKEAEFIINS